MEEILGKVAKQVQGDRKAFTLAEGATHVGMFDNKRKVAFTLAEVLITLGIIGVVSVLTIPNIISNYQKKVYVTQLQKGYAQLQQVFDMAMADDEVEYLADTELMNSIDNAYSTTGEHLEFVSNLTKYLKIQHVCSPGDFSDGCHDIYYFQLNDSDNFIDEEWGYSKAGSNRGGDIQIFTKDGMIYYFSSFSNNLSTLWGDKTCEEKQIDGATACNFLTGNHGLKIDVNGKKGPNRFGRDLFSFFVDERGQVHPLGSSTISGKEYAWDGSVQLDISQCHSESYGTGCAGRIMDQGWVMDY